MLRIGITGGIGSGKTTVSRVFETLGIPVFSADDAAKKLQEENHEVITGIKNIFGEGIYSAGKLNRKSVAEKVFTDVSLLKKLNDIVHPATVRAFDEWLKNHSDKKYILKEAAILYETGLYQSLDKTILVTAPLNLRVERIMKRDNVSAAEVQARIKNQMSDEEKIPLADFVIVNDEQQSIIKQVMEINSKLIN
ncbi:MAG TPA: dephospho-CoA kinase [Bacteroidetes bacterium]|nr:dephospho-CoA kinase [Bacteroidota bacterium]